MKVTRIMIKDACGNQKELQKARLIAGKGISGDQLPSKHGRELSLLDADTAGRIQGLPGLCTGRFTPGITFEGNADGLKSGMLYVLGTAVIRVTQKGKRCFPDCALAQAGNTCGLAQNAVFAEVSQGGWIEKGGSFTLKL